MKRVWIGRSGVVDADKESMDQVASCRKRE